MMLPDAPRPWHGGWRRAEDSQPLRLNRTLLRRILHYAAPYRWALLGTLLTIALGAALDTLQPQLLRMVIDQALPHDTVPGNPRLLAFLSLGILALPLASGLVGVWQRQLTASIGEGLIADLRRDLYAHLLRLGFRFFTSVKTGETMARITTDVVGAQRAITGTAVSVVTNGVLLAATLAAMLALDWRLTTLGLLVLPIFILPSWHVGQRLRQLTRQQLEANARLHGQLTETLNINGILHVKLFGRRQAEQARFVKHVQELRDLGIRLAVTGRWLMVALGLGAAIGSALVYGVGGLLVIHGQLTTGALVAFAVYLARLYGPVTSLASARVDLATALVSFERVFQVLDTPVEIDEKPGAIALARPRGAITFDHVWFSYFELPTHAALGFHADDAPRPAPAPTQGRYWALEDISFQVEPGEFVALVGPSGAGKSTITYLIARLYDPTRGRILLDGIDLRDLTIESLAQAIGMVPQEPYLFHDTIAANLRFARPDATDAELEAAARAAFIHERILELPQGYDTIVGERGYRLSGGEKQRLAIARLILADPPVLVLDEATSSLDSESEQAVQQALATLMRGRTTIVIAHRLSTILAADRILVLDGGRLVEVGHHNELLARNGRYARLYHTQFRHLANGQAEHRRTGNDAVVSTDAGLLTAPES